MKMKLSLTQERLKELLIYAPETGRFYWRKQHGPVNAGSEAGNVRSTGYRLIGIDKHLHYEHRLAWLYVYGVHPTGDIDHDNGNPADSRIATLRELPRSKTRTARAGGATHRGSEASPDPRPEDGVRELRWTARESLSGVTKLPRRLRGPMTRRRASITGNSR